MTEWTSEEYRKHAFDYLRGDLSFEERVLIEREMDRSEEFADYVIRLRGLVESPKAAPPEKEHPFDKDDLFAKIAAEVAPETHALPEPADTDFGELLEFPKPGRWPLVAALAAVALAVFGLWYFSSPPASVTPNIAEYEPAKHQEPDVELASLVKSPSNKGEEVRVFESVAAIWSLEGEKSKTLKLDTGTLLVEYAPAEEDEELEVVTARFRIKVLGTIFYATDEGEGRVGVVTGRVEVTPKSGDPVTLTAGQEYIPSLGIQAIKEKVLESAETHVEVEAHLDRLAEIRIARRLPKPSPDPVKPKATKAHPKHPKQVDLSWKSSANQAMRRGDYEEAARELERGVALLGPRDPLAGTVRLDLARIYINRLNKPQQAAIHLRRFISLRPNDAATSTAKRELCKILGDSGRSDPICE